MFASPVATMRIFWELFQAIAPMFCDAKGLHAGFQDSPASRDIHTPPAADPANHFFGSSGWITSEVTRPARLKGPRHSQRCWGLISAWTWSFQYFSSSTGDASRIGNETCW